MMREHAAIGMPVLQTHHPEFRFLYRASCSRNAIVVTLATTRFTSMTALRKLGFDMSSMPDFLFSNTERLLDALLETGSSVWLQKVSQVTMLGKLSASDEALLSEKPSNTSL
jgi:hypothetical protein